jgi:hypothetical protein
MILDFLNYLMLFWTLPNKPRRAEEIQVVDFIFEIAEAREYLGECFGRLFRLFGRTRFRELQTS